MQVIMLVPRYNASSNASNDNRNHNSNDSNSSAAQSEVSEEQFQQWLKLAQDAVHTHMHRDILVI